MEPNSVTAQIAALAAIVSGIVTVLRASGALTDDEIDDIRAALTPRMQALTGASWDDVWNTVFTAPTIDGEVPDSPP